MLNYSKIILLIFILLPTYCLSTEFHVAPNGSDSTGDGSLSNPWKTPEFGAKQLASGDILSIHSGTYILSVNNLPPDQSSMNRARALVSPPSKVSGTINSPIIIRAAGDGVVFLDAGVSPQWPAIGTNVGDYLEISGFSVRGAAILWSTKGSIIKDCDLFGGIDTPVSNGGDNFGAVIRVEYCVDCIVRNNLLHDNQEGITRANSPLLIEYDTTNLIIENNDVYNSVGIGIRLKDNPNQIHVRNNHIYDNYLSGIQGANQDSGFDLFIYNNIIRNNNTSGGKEYGGISQLIEVTGWQIYNNTFINNKNADIRTNYAGADDIHVWNNIFFNDYDNFYSVGWSNSGATFSGQWTYSDYNTFFGSANWLEHTTVWSSLINFSTATSFDTNSNVSNPDFLCATSKYPQGYKRESYLRNGRGGSYSDVRGAYMTGQEQIGSNKSMPTGIQDDNLPVRSKPPLLFCIQ